MTKIIISGSRLVSIEFSGEWLYMSLADSNYLNYLSNLAHLYREKYKSDSSKIPDIEKILGLMYSENSLRGSKFKVKRGKLFYMVINREVCKKIGVKFVSEFLRSNLYSFGGISTESDIYISL